MIGSSDNTLCCRRRDPLARTRISFPRILIVFVVLWWWCSSAPLGTVHADPTSHARGDNSNLAKSFNGADASRRTHFFTSSETDVLPVPVDVLAPEQAATMQRSVGVYCVDPLSGLLFTGTSDIAVFSLDYREEGVTSDSGVPQKSSMAQHGVYSLDGWATHCIYKNRNELYIHVISRSAFVATVPSTETSSVPQHVDDQKSHLEGRSLSRNEGRESAAGSTLEGPEDPDSVETVSETDFPSTSESFPSVDFSYSEESVSYSQSSSSSSANSGSGISSSGNSGAEVVQPPWPSAYAVFNRISGEYMRTENIDLRPPAFAILEPNVSTSNRSNSESQQHAPASFSSLSLSSHVNQSIASTSPPLSVPESSSTPDLPFPLHSSRQILRGLTLFSGRLSLLPFTDGTVALVRLGREYRYAYGHIDFDKVVELTTGDVVVSGGDTQPAGERRVDRRLYALGTNKVSDTEDDAPTDTPPAISPWEMVRPAWDVVVYALPDVEAVFPDTAAEIPRPFSHEGIFELAATFSFFAYYSADMAQHCPDCEPLAFLPVRETETIGALSTFTTGDGVMILWVSPTVSGTYLSYMARIDPEQYNAARSGTTPRGLQSDRITMSPSAAAREGSPQVRQDNGPNEDGSFFQWMPLETEMRCTSTAPMVQDRYSGDVFIALACNTTVTPKEGTQTVVKTLVSRVFKEHYHSSGLVQPRASASVWTVDPSPMVLSLAEDTWHAMVPSLMYVEQLTRTLQVLVPFPNRAVGVVGLSLFAVQSVTPGLVDGLGGTTLSIGGYGFVERMRCRFPENGYDTVPATFASPAAITCVVPPMVSLSCDPHTIQLKVDLVNATATAQLMAAAALPPQFLRGGEAAVFTQMVTPTVQNATDVLTDHSYDYLAARQVRVLGTGFVPPSLGQRQRCRLWSPNGNAVYYSEDVEYVSSDELICAFGEFAGPLERPSYLDVSNDGVVFSNTSVLYSVLGPPAGLKVVPNVTKQSDEDAVASGRPRDDILTDGTTVAIEVRAGAFTVLPPLAVTIVDAVMHPAFPPNRSMPTGYVVAVRVSRTADRQGTAILPAQDITEAVVGSTVAPVQVTGSAYFERLALRCPMSGEYTLAFTLLHDVGAATGSGTSSTGTEAAAFPDLGAVVGLTSCLDMTVTEGAPFTLKIVRNPSLSVTPHSPVLSIQPIVGLADVCGNLHPSIAETDLPGDVTLSTEVADLVTGVRSYAHWPMRARGNLLFVQGAAVVGKHNQSYRTLFRAASLRQPLIRGPDIRVTWCAPEERAVAALGTCAPCPPHGICNGTDVVLAEDGYWRYNADSSLVDTTNSQDEGTTETTPVVSMFFYDCQQPFSSGACGPNGLCHEGHDGFRCAHCSPGYRPVAKACYRCRAKSAEQFVAFLVCVALIALVALWVLWMAWTPNTLSPLVWALKGIIHTIQLFSLLSTVKTRWPDALVSFFDGLHGMTHIVEVLLGCGVSTRGVQIFLFVMPLLLTLLSAVVVRVVAAAKRPDRVDPVAVSAFAVIAYTHQKRLEFAWLRDEVAAYVEQVQMEEGEEERQRAQARVKTDKHRNELEAAQENPLLASGDPAAAEGLGDISGHGTYRRAAADHNAHVAMAEPATTATLPPPITSQLEESHGVQEEGLATDSQPHPQQTRDRTESTTAYSHLKEFLAENLRKRTAHRNDSLLRSIPELKLLRGFESAAWYRAEMRTSNALAAPAERGASPRQPPPPPAPTEGAVPYPLATGAYAADSSARDRLSLDGEHDDALAPEASGRERGGYDVPADATTYGPDGAIAQVPRLAKLPPSAQSPRSAPRGAKGYTPRTADAHRPSTLAYIGAIESFDKGFLKALRGMSVQLPDVEEIQAWIKSSTQEAGQRGLFMFRDGGGVYGGGNDPSSAAVHPGTPGVVATSQDAFHLLATGLDKDGTASLAPQLGKGRGVGGVRAHLAQYEQSPVLKGLREMAVREHRFSNTSLLANTLAATFVVFHLVFMVNALTWQRCDTVQVLDASDMPPNTSFPVPSFQQYARASSDLRCDSTAYRSIRDLSRAVLVLYGAMVPIAIAVMSFVVRRRYGVDVLYATMPVLLFGLPPRGVLLEVVTMVAKFIACMVVVLSDAPMLQLGVLGWAVGIVCLGQAWTYPTDYELRRDRSLFGMMFEETRAKEEPDSTVLEEAVSFETPGGGAPATKSRRTKEAKRRRGESSTNTEDVLNGVWSNAPPPPPPPPSQPSRKMSHPAPTAAGADVKTASTSQAPRGARPQSVPARGQTRLGRCLGEFITRNPRAVLLCSSLCSLMSVSALLLFAFIDFYTGSGISPSVQRLFAAIVLILFVVPVGLLVSFCTAELAYFVLSRRWLRECEERRAALRQAQLRDMCATYHELSAAVDHYFDLCQTALGKANTLDKLAGRTYGLEEQGYLNFSLPTTPVASSEAGSDPFLDDSALLSSDMTADDVSRVGDDAATSQRRREAALARRGMPRSAPSSPRTDPRRRSAASERGESRSQNAGRRRWGSAFMSSATTLSHDGNPDGMDVLPNQQPEASGWSDEGSFLLPPEALDSVGGLSGGVLVQGDHRALPGDLRDFFPSAVSLVEPVDNANWVSDPKEELARQRARRASRNLEASAAEDREAPTNDATSREDPKSYAAAESTAPTADGKEDLKGRTVRTPAFSKIPRPAHQPKFRRSSSLVLSVRNSPEAELAPTHPQVQLAEYVKHVEAQKLPPVPEISLEKLTISKSPESVPNTVQDGGTTERGVPVEAISLPSADVTSLAALLPSLDVATDFDPLAVAPLPPETPRAPGTVGSTLTHVGGKAMTEEMAAFNAALTKELFAASPDAGLADGGAKIGVASPSMSPPSGHLPRPVPSSSSSAPTTVSASERNAALQRVLQDANLLQGLEGVDASLAQSLLERVGLAPPASSARATSGSGEDTDARGFGARRKDEGGATDRTTSGGRTTAASAGGTVAQEGPRAPPPLPTYRPLSIEPNSLSLEDPRRRRRQGHGGGTDRHRAQRPRPRTTSTPKKRRTSSRNSTTADQKKRASTVATTVSQGSTAATGTGPRGTRPPEKPSTVTVPDGNVSLQATGTKTSHHLSPNPQEQNPTGKVSDRGKRPQDR